MTLIQSEKEGLISFDDLQKLAAGQKNLGSRDLERLLQNPTQIPAEWAGKTILFMATKKADGRGKEKCVSVRILRGIRTPNHTTIGPFVSSAETEIQWEKDIEYFWFTEDKNHPLQPLVGEARFKAQNCAIAIR